MQGLSPEHPNTSQPLHTMTPEGTPEGSPHQIEVPVVTPPHGETSDVPVVTTPPPQVERTDSLEDF
jgi:hypothetical protein